MTFDRAALAELLDYTDFTWGAYRRVIRELPDDALNNPVDGSGWPALANALFHIAGAWDEWLRDAAGETYEAQEIAWYTESWERLDEYRGLTRGWLRRALERTSDDALDEPDVTLKRVPNAPPGFEVPTTRQIVVHLLLHERGHHGDISTLMHSLGGKLPPIDYLGYLAWKQRKAAR
jgi:uncharacterized damage-inducible protein DinB